MQMPTHFKNGQAGWLDSITTCLAPFLAFPSFLRGPSRLLCTPLMSRCSSRWLTPPRLMQLQLVLAGRLPPPRPTSPPGAGRPSLVSDGVGVGWDVRSVLPLPLIGKETDSEKAGA